MKGQPAEQTEIHTRLLRFTLGIAESRAYWAEIAPEEAPPTPLHAFEGHWFGTRSQSMVELIIRSLRVRYDAYPEALAMLHRWREVSPDTRRHICHWHVQLSDPIYRKFSGQFLPSRRGTPRAEVTRQRVIRWVEDQFPGRWSTSTVIKWASKLLTTAHEAGLVKTNRDPRQLVYPRISDEALAYCLHLLRGVSFDGTMTENPYLASVGLVGSVLEDRLRTLAGVTFRRMGDLVEFHWDAPDLATWAETLR